MPDRALLIDDDSQMAEMLKTWLGLRGVQVHHCVDLREGQRALRLAQWDLLLLDLSLPDGDGLDFCRQLRMRDPNLPVLMLTARGDSMDKVIGLENGADDYLAKPFEASFWFFRTRGRCLLKLHAPRAESSNLREGFKL